MERYNEILRHPVFLDHMKRLEALEEKRIYCKHGLDHLRDVCRLSYIVYLQDRLAKNPTIEGVVFQNRSLMKDLLYGASLLHDVGRVEEYEGKGSHDVMSALLAGEILPDCGYSMDETAMIQLSILGHRRSGTKKADEAQYQELFQKCEALCNMKEKDLTVFLSYALKRADHGSRECFHCLAYETCNWNEERKNMGLDGGI
ncbi:MAG: hypothetical protein K6C69_08610 [Lachnospiraceae bacterium]|nr:hypothetical protein [Lachnospiraceae bacterium]